MNHPPPIHTEVDVDIAQGLARCRGRILEAEYDDGWLYRIEVTRGDACDDHRHADGELWVCEFEVTPVNE
jgi:hypothetical protein